jgi:hypothetical protein
MNRQQIVAEIKRIALDNGGDAPGIQAFGRTTGIKKSDWYPHIWLRWGDALVEAGYAPNTFQTKTSDEVLLEKYIEFARELGRLPVEGEIRRKARGNVSFPNHSAFYRFGGKQKLLAALAAYCRRAAGFEDVLALCVEGANASAGASAERGGEVKVATGFVYLMKSGPHYKIGRTNSLGRSQFHRQQFTVLKPMIPSESKLTGTGDSPINVGRANGSHYRRRT